jgi:hypothetical protein
MTKLIITIDLDWACEPAIEETLSFFLDRMIKPTLFITHHSKAVEHLFEKLEVGLHPFFGANSSHGTSITEVVNYVTSLPHNLKAFRSHRFGICNLSKQAMIDAGMRISSNVCTNLETISPFFDRNGLLEVPIFLEDGGYLWLKQSLQLNPNVTKALQELTPKVILIHPMHFVINTPCFDYMLDIKRRFPGEQWQNMDSGTLKNLRFVKRGIRDFITDILDLAPDTLTMGELCAEKLKLHNHF